MKTLEVALGMERRFAVANSPWSNGTCEWIMREVVRTLKAIVQEDWTYPDTEQGRSCFGPCPDTKQGPSCFGSNIAAPNNQLD